MLEPLSNLKKVFRFCVPDNELSELMKTWNQKAAMTWHGLPSEPSELDRTLCDPSKSTRHKTKVLVHSEELARSNRRSKGLIEHHREPPGRLVSRIRRGPIELRTIS